MERRRKTKNKNKKTKNRRNPGRSELALPGAVRARVVRKGPGQSLPLYRMWTKMQSFRMQCLAAAFKTKTNLTGSQIKGAAAAYGFALAWSVVDLPFNFANLWDQFRIRKVVVSIRSSKNTNVTGVGSILYIVEDYDNSNLLTSVANAQTYQNCQQVSGSDAGEGESIQISLTPCIPIPSILGNEIKPCPWQDLAVTNNTHYGIKGWYQTAATTDPVWDVDAQYWIDVINTQ